MENRSAFIKSQIAFTNSLFNKPSIYSVRRSHDRIKHLMPHFHKDKVSIEKISVEGMNCAMIIPKDELSGGVVLYIHGGGFVCGDLDYACLFGSTLAAKCGIRVFVMEYRLAPEHPFPAAIDDVMSAYGYLLSNGYDPSRIVLCGESCGGGLCYSLCQKLRDKGRTLPAGIVAISPWTDLTMSSESYEINRHDDTSMTVERLKYFADCYIWGASPDSKGKLRPNVNSDPEDDSRFKSEPRISPLFDSQDRMPESLIFVGEKEIMYDDSVILHQKLLSAGCKSEIVVAEDMWHAYLLYSLPERKGDFDKIYKFIKKMIPSRKRLAWMSLDNAAKIFPAARSRTWSSMFRISSTLDEDIDREVLKTALDVTLRRFPSIAVAIKEGLFWYYLEEIREAPEIRDEKPYPLAGMTMKELRKCAFRVIVYKNRLAVEFFHSLTDGNGGFIFTKTLTAEYLYQKYGIRVPVGDGILDRLEEPTEAELEDAFFKNAGDYPVPREEKNSFCIDGEREIDGYRTVTTFIIDPEFIKREAKARGVSITVYLCAILIEATHRVQQARVPNPAKYKPVKILLPVNLRTIFGSETLRNFILHAVVGVDPRMGDYTFDEICQIVAAQMKQQVTKKNMSAMIRKNVNIELNPLIRAVPLVIKNIVMKAAYKLLGERSCVFTFSNLGVIKVPEEYSSRVKRMDAVLGSQSSAPYNLTSMTYGDKMYLNVTRNANEPVLEREIYHVLREKGVPHEIESNTRGKERN